MPYFFQPLKKKKVMTPNVGLELTTRDQELHTLPTGPARCTDTLVFNIISQLK